MGLTMMKNKPKTVREEIRFVSQVIIRSGNNNLCLRLPREVKMLVKKGDIYQVTIKKLKGGERL